MTKVKALNILTDLAVLNISLFNFKFKIQKFLFNDQDLNCQIEMFVDRM